jgi:hypothetical protein
MIARLRPDVRWPPFVEVLGRMVIVRTFTNLSGGGGRARLRQTARD